jgi:hypothetical protein
MPIASAQEFTAAATAAVVIYFAHIPAQVEAVIDAFLHGFQRLLSGEQDLLQQAAAELRRVAMVEFLVLGEIPFND